MDKIADIMKYETAGDPVSGCKWTRKTTGKIAKQLERVGIQVSAKTVGRLLKKMNYSLRGRLGDVHKYINCCYDHLCIYVRPHQSVPISHIKAACKEKGIEYKGCFDCQGFLAEAMHAPVQKKIGMSDEQWSGMVKQMTGHPNEEDVEKANAFAREILG